MNLEQNLCVSVANNTIIQKDMVIHCYRVYYKSNIGIFVKLSMCWHALIFF